MRWSRHSSSASALALLVAASAAINCGDAPTLAVAPSEGGGAGMGGDAEGGSTSTATFDPVTGGGSDVGGMGGGGMSVAAACGDTKIDPGELCDDGNGVSGDGCSAGCDAVENDFVCPVPGQPCVSTVVCGDGKVTGTETCDDQNTVPLDGCDATCAVEPGWTCPVIGAACVAAACGDGLLAGDEACEDGGAPPVDGDGCSSSCQLEPGFKCTVIGQPCEPTVCGDGVVEGSEQCDDGNNDLGDGCTPQCINEPTCNMAGPCSTSCGDGIMLPAGGEECEDGNTDDGDGCSAQCTIEPGFTCTDVSNDDDALVLPIVLRDFQEAHPDMQHVVGTETGIVDVTLGSDQKPIYANANGTTTTTTGKTNFDHWYNDTPGINQTFLQTITLTKQPSGTFLYSDGDFFPLTDLGFGNEGQSRNFHFTSEVRYWFEYQGDEALNFTGDDDVWVFVNKQLAVDLGGVHGALSGGIVLDSTAATNFGLAVGSIYEIVVFQAERHRTQSNYQLTLGNFDNPTSVCTSVCGDGIKTPDEICDDGINDGSYGHCTEDCDWGPYCGDAIVQSAEEECDDGVNLTPYGGCAPGCKLGAFCGDGVVDSLFGEQCDDGVNDGGYDECDAGCLLGSRCGDGTVDAPQEECDDGNKAAGDGCDLNCLIEQIN